MNLTTYRVTFPRIGRSTNGSFVEEFRALDADDLAAQIFKFARAKTASQWFEVLVDMETMTGSLEYGRFGTFSIEEVVAVPA